MFKHKIFAATFTVLSALAAPASAELDAGAFLAAQSAGTTNDFEAAATYFSEALQSDTSNPYMLESLMTSYLALGEMDQAATVAQTMVDLEIESQIAHLVLDAQAAKSGDWAVIFDALAAGRTIGPLVDGLSQAWAYAGLGQMNKALESFDTVIETPGLANYGKYQKALALALVGDFEGADAIFSAAGDNTRHSRNSAIAHAQILSQLGRNADALSLLDQVFGPAPDPTLAVLRDQFASDAAVPFSVISSPAEGLAEAYMIITGALRDDAPDAYVLLYTRAAEYLHPSDINAILTAAELLDSLGRYNLASETYTRIPADHPAYPSAEIGRAEVLHKAGRTDAAIEVLQALARSYPDLPQVFATLADTLRRDDQIQEANAAYTQALDLYRDDNPGKWFSYYTRGITFHKMDDWPSAEADFRAALALRPDQAQVLNYLGYSLVERGEKLDEALEMIKTAVAAQPQNGAIVDSLGWVLFELGQYVEALPHLEQAATLEATDPTVNDHLGDAYWAVGRKIEAQFQWQRALSFDPADTVAERIRRKLELGLDVVRAEEGAVPIIIETDQ